MDEMTLDKMQCICLKKKKQFFSGGKRKGGEKQCWRFTEKNTAPAAPKLKGAQRKCGGEEDRGWGKAFCQTPRFHKNYISKIKNVVFYWWKISCEAPEIGRGSPMTLGFRLFLNISLFGAHNRCRRSPHGASDARALGGTVDSGTGEHVAATLWLEPTVWERFLPGPGSEPHPRGNRLWVRRRWKNKYFKCL